MDEEIDSTIMLAVNTTPPRLILHISNLCPFILAQLCLKLSYNWLANMRSASGSTERASAGSYKLESESSSLSKS